MNGYEDIIALPPHVSALHPPMPRSSRAAQFSPFAALTGYDAEISEAMRRTYPRFYFSTDQQEELNDRLVGLIERSNEHPRVKLTYFVTDERKVGGTYVTVCGELKRYDEYERALLFCDGRRVFVDDLCAIE